MLQKYTYVNKDTISRYAKKHALMIFKIMRKILRRPMNR